ncbi:FZR2 [Scenedesmus sp. PABB004]|nr:FZR2 [Scenedesmus sp. PABB004]
MQHMQIDGGGAPAPAGSSSGGAGSSFAGGGQQPLPFGGFGGGAGSSSSMGPPAPWPSQQQHAAAAAAQQQWPGGLFGLPGVAGAGASQPSYGGGGGGGVSGASGGGGEPRTPVGSPMKQRGGGGAAGAGSLGSPGWFSPKSRVRYSDRFIPSRASAARLDFSALDREVTSDQVARAAHEREDINPAYNMLLRSELLGCQCPSPISPDKAAQLEQLRGAASPSKKILRFKTGDAASPVAGPPVQSPFLTSPVGVESLLGSPVMTPRRPTRKIPRAPYKVLDAPALADDFYLNLVDWSSQNLLAVGLDACVYLWSAHTSKVTKLCDLAPGDSVCSVAWSQRGTYLSVGTNAGEVQIWDVTKLRRTRTMAGHRQRVGTQAWSSHMLASGSRDKAVLLRDVRVPEPYVDRLAGHKSEVCGLKWAPDDRQLASGGNDNALLIWAPGAGGAGGGGGPVSRFTEHTAAVKAIAWSPHQHGLLASGGGTADRCIRFWNTSTGAALNAVDTGSQVCNLAWSRHVNELVSAHGYSQNQVIVWKYPSMAKLATLTGHSYRVLYLALAPDGQTIVTGAGDETLRFWAVFPGARGGGPGGGPGGPAARPAAATRAAPAARWRARFARRRAAATPGGGGSGEHCAGGRGRAGRGRRLSGGAMSAAPAGKRLAGPTTSARAPAAAAPGEAPAGAEAAPSPLPELPEPLVLHVLDLLPPALQAWAAKLVCKAARERFRGATVVSLCCPGLPLAAVREAWRAVRGDDPWQQLQLARARAACGDVAGLAWLRGSGCDMDGVCEAAAEHGQVAVLEWARDQGLDLCDVCRGAAAGGHLDVLRWARKQTPPVSWGGAVCFYAARRGDLEMLRWARAQAEPAPWGESACYMAAKFGHLEVLRWLRANGCPWLRGLCEHVAADHGHDAVAAWIRAQPE